MSSDESKGREGIVTINIESGMKIVTTANIERKMYIFIITANKLCF